MRSLVFAVALVAVQAATAQTNFVRPIPITDLSIRHALPGASILPPGEPGWFLIAKGEAGIAFARQGTRLDNSLSATVMISLLQQPVDSIEQLRRQTDLTPENTNSQRFRIVRFSAGIDPTRKEMCILRRWQVEDRGAVKHSSAEFLLQSSVDLICRHPDNSRLIYTVHLSERDQPGGEAARLEHLASSYQAGFQFETLPPRQHSK